MISILKNINFLDYKFQIQADFLKFNGIEELANQFDHTTVVAADDPHIEIFKKMDKLGLIQLRVMKHVGCERFAEWVYNLINDKMQKETDGRVSVLKVEAFEGGTNNSAIYNPYKKNEK